MRFRITEFEQLFSQSDLEKGFRLCKNKKVELTEKNGNHFGYAVSGQRISLHQTASEIENCYCDCGRPFCQHVAAVMFSSLNLKVGAKPRARKQVIVRPSVAAFRSVFTSLHDQWKSAVGAGAAPGALAALLSEIRSVLAEGRFTNDMAALAALSLPGRVSATSEQVGEITNRIILKNFGSSLHKIDEEVMYCSLMELVRTNERVASGRLNALLPVYLNVCSDMFRLEELRTALSKRHLRKFHDEIFDELQTARTMVNYRSVQMGGREVTLNRSSSAESFVALARLHFAAQEVENGWKVLEELKVLTRETAPLGYFSLLGYLVSLSRALNDPKRQLMYTEELMLYSPYLSGPVVQSYLALLPGSKNKQHVLELMQRIIATRSESTADKVFALTMASGITEPFLRIIQRSKVRFVMVHEVFMKFNHAFNEEELGFYLKALSESLLHPEPHQSPVALLESASRFFRELGAAGRPLARKVTQLLVDHPMLRPLGAVWEKSNTTGIRPVKSVSLRA